VFCNGKINSPQVDFRQMHHPDKRQFELAAVTDVMNDDLADVAVAVSGLRLTTMLALTVYDRSVLLG
jgi:hypothetical protein